MLAFLSSIPFIGGIVQKIVSAYFDAKVRLVTARLGVDRDVAVTMVKASVAAEHENVSRLGIFASNKLLTFLLIAFALPLVAFEWKVIIFDKMLALGSTDPITGQVADWGNTIIYFLFGAPTVMGIGKMWFGRDKSGE